MELRLQAALQGSLPWWPSVSLPYDYNLQQPLPESVPGQKDPQWLLPCLMAFGHLLDRKALAVYQLTQGFNCLFLKLYERFHF